MKLKQWLAHGWLEEKKVGKKKNPTHTRSNKVAAKKMVAVDGMAVGDSGSGFIASPFSFCQLRRPNVSLSPSLSRGSTLGYLMILKFTMRCTCILFVFWRETSRNIDLVKYIKFILGGGWGIGQNKSLRECHGHYLKV